jgi:hypothetical protein
MRDVLNNILTVEPTPPSQAVDAEVAMKAKESRRKLGPARPQPAAVNEAIERVVLKALAKQQEQRYSSAGELAKDVANYLAGLPTVAGGARARQGSDAALVAWVAAGAVAVIAIVAGMIVYRANKTHVPSGAAAPMAVQLGAAKLPATEAAALPATNASPPADAIAENAQDAPPATQMAASAAAAVMPDDAEPFEGHHYKFVPGSIDWNGAAAKCRELGGHLAWPVTIDQRGFLQQLKGPYATAWIGGRKSAGENWIWSNGVAIDPGLVPPQASIDGFNWLFMMRNGKLSARPESGNLQGASIPTVEGFLCQWDP